MCPLLLSGPVARTGSALLLSVQIRDASEEDSG